jgi:hypothetical protein
LQVESQEFTCPKNPVVHFAHKGVDTNYKKEAIVPGTELRRAIFPAPSPSKKDRKEFTTTVTPFYPDILFIGGGGGGDWSHLPSPTMSQPCQGKNLPNEKLDDEGTDTGIFGDITRLGSGTQRSPYPGM